MTLVLLPGMDGTGELFTPLIHALGPEIGTKVVAYPTSAEVGYSALREVARASVPTNGPFVILAESFSGPIAIELAASSPAGLQGLILCCSFVRNPRPAILGFRRLIDRISPNLIPISLLSFFLLGGFSTRALRAALRRALSQVSTRTLRARLDAVSEVDVSAQLASVSVPVLCLTSTRDRVVPLSATAEIARLQPTAKIVLVDAPHFMLQAAPESATREIKAFLRDLALNPARV